MSSPRNLTDSLGNWKRPDVPRKPAQTAANGPAAPAPEKLKERPQRRDFFVGLVYIGVGLLLLTQLALLLVFDL